MKNKLLMAICLGWSVSAIGQTGAAAGDNATNAGTLRTCKETLGTLAVHEDQTATWWHTYRSRYPTLGSTIPVLRTMIQQSNCFVVVERGRAMQNAMQERNIERSGEAREGSNFGKGQMVAADYTMSPEIQFSAKGTSGVGGALSSFGSLGRLAAGVAGGMKTNEASTTLLLIDNRSSVQIASSVGAAKTHDFGFLGGAGGGGGAGGVGAFMNTPEGKTIVSAFADSYNQMIDALQNYKAQQVKGGLGKGGRLGVGQ